MAWSERRPPTAIAGAGNIRCVGVVMEVNVARLAGGCIGANRA